MYKKNKILIILFLFSIISFQLLLAANPDKSKVYNDMIKKYGKINTISVVCEDSDNLGNMVINAKQGNKYRIKMNNMEIVTNGKSIWSYSSQRKLVVISSFVEDDAGISLDNIFFNVIPDLQPISLQSVVSNKKTKQYRLELHNNKKNSEIKIIYLYIDDKITKIEGIEIIGNNNKHKVKWDIKKLEINKSMPDSIFIFNTPEGVEEIDTR